MKPKIKPWQVGTILRSCQMVDEVLKPLIEELPEGKLRAQLRNLVVMAAYAVRQAKSGEVTNVFMSVNESPIISDRLHDE